MADEVKVTSLSNSGVAMLAVLALMSSCSTLTKISNDVRAMRCASQPAVAECKANG